ncbi:MAG: hypothetical protein LBJ67_13265 [Planctomycetaceae bacterium]|jgi:hypothetical protein|nr:hypothetical protein [Planctomycetaceae bacterium]
MVAAGVKTIKTFSDLRFWVYEMLCEHHELLMNSFPTSETLIKRSGQDACGVMFCLYGPRAVRITAIWEKEKNRVLFYGPTGKRYHQIELNMLVVSNQDLLGIN